MSSRILHFGWDSFSLNVMIDGASNMSGIRNGESKNAAIDRIKLENFDEDTNFAPTRWIICGELISSIMRITLL